MDNVALGGSEETLRLQNPPRSVGRLSIASGVWIRPLCGAGQKWGAVSGMGLARDRFPGTWGKTSSYGPWGM